MPRSAGCRPTMPNDSRPVLTDERLAGFGYTAHMLHQALGYLRCAHFKNSTMELGLTLPDEQEIVDAINACAKAREREKT